MAWSDAARAAAAEARRMHRTSLPEARLTAKRANDFQRSAYADSSKRKHLAISLRAIRAGNKPPRIAGVTASGRIGGQATDARISTAARNLLRKK